MIGRVRRALRRGTLGGSLVLAITGGAGLVDATTALASSDYTISRYAGQANLAGGATPGPALSSPLGFVVGAGLDSAGNLYIVDPNNVAVEKVTPAGTLSIFAGTGQSGPPVPGPASSSTLNNQLRHDGRLHGRTTAWARTPVLPHELQRQSPAHGRPCTDPPRALRLAGSGP